MSCVVGSSLPPPPLSSQPMVCPSSSFLSAPRMAAVAAVSSSVSSSASRAMLPPSRSASAPLPLSSSAVCLSSSAPSPPSLVPIPDSDSGSVSGGGRRVSSGLFGSFSSLSACLPPSPSLEARRRSVPASCSSVLPYVVLPSGVRHYFYFAIGSMCNPVSLLLRGIQPVLGCSTAGLLRNYRLVFHGEAGMADIQRVDESAAPSEKDKYGDHFHGVLHLISEAHLAVLDRIEAGYRRIVAHVQLYDGSTQAAYVYQMFDTPLMQRQRHGLPSERYIDIISRGCQHYNVCPEYVSWLQTLPCVPRPQHSQLLSLPVPVESRLFSVSDLAACDGEDGRDLCIAVNGKVLRYVGEPDAPLPSACCDSPTTGSFSAYAHMKAEYAGRDVTYLLSLMCYEPMFPVASCAAEMSEQHRMRIEDMYARKLACLASFAFDVVGTLVDEAGTTELDNSSVGVGVSSSVPISPRTATASGVLLDGRHIDEFKARRRRGSLTSTILLNVARIIELQAQTLSSSDRETEGDEMCSYQNQSRIADNCKVVQPAAAAAAVVVDSAHLLSHSPVSGPSIASSTARLSVSVSTTVSLRDYDCHSPLPSDVSDGEGEESDEELSEAVDTFRVHVVRV